jgi:TonB-linked SusC/RagA family outer membrane protein
MKKYLRSNPILLKIMRILLVQAFIVSAFAGITLAHDTYAQEILDKRLTLEVDNKPIARVLSHLEQSIGIKFVYSPEVIKATRKVSLHYQDERFANILQNLLSPFHITYEIIGSQIVLKRVTTEEEIKLNEQTLPSFIITGTVKDENGSPMPGVNVSLKETTIGTSSDVDGKYTITASDGSGFLVFSFIGYNPVEVPVNNQSIIDVTMQPDIKSLNEVVVVGYGTQKRSDLTGAIASVPKARFAELPVTNLLQAIQGTVAGVNITQGSSVPGSSASALVRGVNSINASTGPFVVVDGIPFSTSGGSINDINTNDIASVEILKDASAVAIYGTRGSNGVILITTKRGGSGKPVIRYNAYTGLENIAHLLTPSSPDLYVKKYADYMKQVGLTQTTILPNAYEIANYNAGKTVDWIKEVTRQGMIQDHSLSISGGTKDVKYFVSGEFLNQKGVVKGYQYRRANFRSNLDVNITDYLTAGTSLFFTNNNYDGGRANFYLAASMSPYGSLYNSVGDYEIYPMNPELLYTNPLLGLYTDRLSRTNNLNSNFYAELKPSFLPGLKYRINVGYSYVPTLEASYVGRKANNTLGTASVTNTETKNWIVENILTYTKEWDKHHIDFTGLYSAQETTYSGSGATATGFINDQLSYKNLGAGATQTASSSQWKTNLLSQMGRVNYTYDSRYLFTVTARRDGYSAFGSNTDKYGLFSSAAVGWNISNESFMQDLSFVDNLKLRVSYGKTGNQAISPNQTITNDVAVRFPFSGLSTIGVLASVLGNKNLTWETTTGLNIGTDFSFLQSRISGTIELYKTRTDDLLLRRSIPNITGYSSVWDNLGKLSNKGIEVTLHSINLKAGDFKWETNLNFSANRNKIVELYGDGKDDITNRWFLGNSLRIIYDYKMIGVWQDGEDHSIDPGTKSGDLKFADTNNDGKITPEDRVIQGTTLPKWIGGLTNTFHYKNFHLNVFIQTFQGAVKNNVNLTFADEAARMNTSSDIGYWTAENKSNTRPSLVYTNTRGYGYPSDNSYTRIKDVTLSYTVPQAFLEKIKLSSLTIYASGRNLYTFTKWKGWDPENDFTFRGSGDWTNNYPLVRSFILGINVTPR